MAGSNQSRWDPAQIALIEQNFRDLGLTPENSPGVFEDLKALLGGAPAWPMLQQRLGAAAEEAAAGNLGSDDDESSGDSGPGPGSRGSDVGGNDVEGGDAADNTNESSNNASQGNSRNRETEKSQKKLADDKTKTKADEGGTVPGKGSKGTGASTPTSSNAAAPSTGKSAAPGGGPAPKAPPAGGAKVPEGGGGGGGAASKIDLALKAARLKEIAEQEGKLAAAKEAAKIAVQAAKDKIMLAVVANPWFWIILAALLIILILGMVIYMFMVFAGKTTDLAGGSEIIPMEYPRHAALQESVKQAVASEKIVFADNSLLGDIEWKTRTVSKPDPNNNTTVNSSEKYMVLDWRTMVTLDYLAKKWDRIRVSLLYSNGPAYTRRVGVWKVGSIDSNQIGKFIRLFMKRDLSVLDEAPITTISGYRTGQALGIDQIGFTSPALTAACFLGIKKPVQVGWQRIIRLDIVRILYEKLQVDGYTLYDNLPKLKSRAVNSEKNEFYAKKSAEGALEKDSWDNLSVAAMDQLIGGLTQATMLISLDIRTIGYFGRAKAKLIQARDVVKSKTGVERVKIWNDQEQVRQPILDGLQLMYRGMQVANMGKWRGSVAAGMTGLATGAVVGGPVGAVAGAVKSECKFWKAYEARQNVRQLTLDMLQMPFDPAYAVPQKKPDDPKDNEALQVKQLIVYSPEDDLDNGISEFDVYPNGAVAVDEGGVGYDGTARDGVLDWRDLHFMAPPLDNGVFSKPGTIFVYETADPNFHGFFNSVKTLWRGLEDWGEFVFDDLWTGAGASFFSGEDVEKVSYRNFVHIGF
jgi:hypothetical protein